MIHLVQDYFSQSAQRYPDKPAVCCDGQSISFQALDEFTNSFARDLKKNGITRQSFVPFFMKKSISSIKSILSILKADCAYVPIDVSSPGQRIESILSATSAKAIIVDNHSQSIIEALLPEDERPQLLNIEQHKLTDTSAIEYDNISIDLSYVLFTSGSTGIPKGVMIPHKAIIDYIDWCVDAYALTDNDVIANHAPLYFDNSTFDLYTAFKTGATLHLVHDELNAVLPFLVRWIEDNQISTFFCVPSVLTLLMQSRRLKDGLFNKLRHVICAGEALPPMPLKFWMDKYPHIQYTNMYGPTEITVDCSYYFIHEKPDENTTTIPIGKARKNMELFVRAEDGQLSQSCGAKGELLVRGTSVAYGYLGDAEKSANSFIQNPLNDTFHDPLYCTGDLVEIDSNGNYLFLGRADDQIKFLGYRIELGEIEASLTKVDYVEECVVVVNRDETTKDVVEIGALVKMTQDDVSVLVADLKDRLPNYMVPTRITKHNDDYPRTPNGKYDRKAVTKLVF